MHHTPIPLINDWQRKRVTAQLVPLCFNITWQFMIFTSVAPFANVDLL